MSNRTHEGESSFQVHVDKELLSTFDKAIKFMGYKNRADWLREKMRESINIARTEGWSKEKQSKEGK